MFHVFHDCLLPYGLLNFALRFDVEWICVEMCYFALLRHFGLILATPCLPQELGKASRIRLSCCCDFGLGLVSKRIRRLVENMLDEMIWVGDLLLVFGA